MPRAPRIHVPGGVHHAVLRGNHRQAIFAGREEYLAFEAFLGAALDRYGAVLLAYCWMTNHVHLAIRVGEAPLGAVMRDTASRYARWRQRTVPTTGHLFERRYRARPVDADRYLLALVRYIHLNPSRAGIVTDLCAWPWSSHHAYLGRGCPAWLQVGPVMELLGHSTNGARKAYRRLMDEDLPEEEQRAVSVGALIAPSGRHAAATPAAASGRQPCAPRDLDAIAAEVAREHGLDLAELQSRCRHAGLVRARREIARRALREGAANLSQVAGYLGRAPSTLSNLLREDREGRLSKP